MDLNRAMLVMLMFVVILGLGLASLLTTLASLVNRRSRIRAHWLHVNWIVLLLLAYFNLFWHSLDILEIEAWGFGGFLFIIAGAIIIFFAASVLLPAPLGEGQDTRSAYFSVTRQFFLLYALAQAWLVMVDLLYGGGYTPASVFNSIGAGLGTFLALSQSVRTHAVGTALAWALMIGALLLRGGGYLG